MGSLIGYRFRFVFMWRGIKFSRSRWPGWPGRENSLLPNARPLSHIQGQQERNSSGRLLRFQRIHFFVFWCTFSPQQQQRNKGQFPLQESTPGDPGASKYQHEDIQHETIGRGRPFLKGVGCFFMFLRRLRGGSLGYQDFVAE